MTSRRWLSVPGLFFLAGCSGTNSHVVTKLNAEAALTGNIPFDILKWRVITVGVDPHDSTMFTVFGNDAAVEYSRSHAMRDYPVGSVIALATWHQQEDGRWFGAKIPARPVTVELVEVRTRDAGGLSNVYRAYQDAPLRETTTAQIHAERRAAYILSVRAAVMP